MPCATVVCDTAKVRFFKQITTVLLRTRKIDKLFAILQKYDFSSKSQRKSVSMDINQCCLRYCKSTIFQANHNAVTGNRENPVVVCDTAKVRFFKQITTTLALLKLVIWLFAILQKYDFSSKSQHLLRLVVYLISCLRYCKSTIFQANHNETQYFFLRCLLFAILQKYDFSSKSQPHKP